MSVQEIEDAITRLSQDELSELTAWFATNVDQQRRKRATVDAYRDHFYFTASREEFWRVLNEVAEMNRGLPVLPDVCKRPWPHQ